MTNQKNFIISSANDIAKTYYHTTSNHKKVSGTNNPENIGAAVRECLSKVGKINLRKGESASVKASESLKLLLENIGVGSLKELSETCEFCSVDVDKSMTIAPSVPDIKTKSFEYIPDKEIQLDLHASDFEIGEAVLAALASTRQDS